MWSGECRLGQTTHTRRESNAPVDAVVELVPLADWREDGTDHGRGLLRPAHSRGRRLVKTTRIGWMRCRPAKQPCPAAQRRAARCLATDATTGAADGTYRRDRFSRLSLRPFAFRLYPLYSKPPCRVSRRPPLRPLRRLFALSSRFLSISPLAKSAILCWRSSGSVRARLRASAVVPRKSSTHMTSSTSRTNSAVRSASQAQGRADEGG